MSWSSILKTFFWRLSLSQTTFASNQTASVHQSKNSMLLLVRKECWLEKKELLALHQSQPMVIVVTRFFWNLRS